MLFLLGENLGWFCAFLVSQEVAGLRTMMKECPEDREMMEMVTEELDQAAEEEKRLQNLLLKSLLPRDDADVRDCILEVRAGKSRSTPRLNVRPGFLLFFCDLWDSTASRKFLCGTGTGGEEASLFAMEIFKM